MAPQGEVEFFTDDGPVFAADEDAVDFGRGQVPRWAIVVACALALIAVLSVAVSRSHPKPAHVAVDKPVTVDDTVSEFGPALRFDGGGADALDALIHGNRLYVLRTGAISVVDLPTGDVQSLPLTGEYSIAAHSSARLVFDADADRLWVLAPGSGSATVLEINAGRMLPIRHVTMHSVVRDAAAMGGHLYVATPAGLADLSPGASTATLLPAVHGAVVAVAADPARDRLLVLDAATPGSVVVVSAGRSRVRGHFAELSNASIAIVGHEIWVGGFGRGGEGRSRAIVARLDPVTFAPLQSSQVAAQVGQVVVSPGTRDVWLSTNTPGLWCVDAGTGHIRQHWPSGTVPVTSQLGAAYAIEAGSVVPLVLKGCAG